MIKNKQCGNTITPAISRSSNKRFTPINAQHRCLGIGTGGRSVVKESDDVWDKDFGDIIVDKEKTKRFSYRYRGSMRMSMGLFFSNNEYDKWRKSVLSKKLP